MGVGGSLSASFPPISRRGAGGPRQQPPTQQPPTQQPPTQQLPTQQQYAAQALWQPIGRNSAGSARTPAELKRAMDEALERASHLSEERVSGQHEREEAEERGWQATQVADKALAHVRLLVERDAKEHRESPQLARSHMYAYTIHNL